MEIKTTGKFIKYLLILQILILIGIGICEIVQLSEINKSQQIIINHPNDWDYLVGYTNDFMIVMAKVYNWVIMFISIGILGRSLSSFNKRWKNIQDYSDKSQNILLLVLWCISTIPSIIILSSSNGMKSCSKSSYTYPVTQRLLRQCNAYLASLLLAYILILSIIIQLLFHLVVVKHQKKINNIKQPTITEGPKLKRVRRSKRVAKKRTSLKSAFSNGTRLSVVTEDDEDKRNSNKSSRSMRSVRNNKILGANHSKFNNEKQVYSNV